MVLPLNPLPVQLSQAGKFTSQTFIKGKADLQTADIDIVAQGFQGCGKSRRHAVVREGEGDIHPQVLWIGKISGAKGSEPPVDLI